MCDDQEYSSKSLNSTMVTGVSREKPQGVKIFKNQIILGLTILASLVRCLGFCCHAPGASINEEVISMPAFIFIIKIRSPE